MANLDRADGFTVMAPVCPLQPYNVVVTNAPAFFTGDCVVAGTVGATTDGNVSPSTDGSEIKIIGATSGQLATLTAGTIHVHDDQDQRYTVQGVTGTAANQNMMNAASDTSVTAGDANTGLSRHELLISTVSTSAGQWKMHDLANVVGQTLAEHARFVVRPNEHINKLVAGI
jgi:hypothetical protein